MRSRAFRAASRASAASTAFWQIFFASAGCSSHQVFSAWPTAELTRPSTSPLSSLPLVWPSNCGSGSFTLMTATRPSRQSSPLTVSCSPLPFSLRMPVSFAYALSVRVTAVLNPERCVPPSVVLMLLAKQVVDSE